MRDADRTERRRQEGLLLQPESEALRSDAHGPTHGTAAVDDSSVLEAGVQGVDVAEFQGTLPDPGPRDVFCDDVDGGGVGGPGRALGSQREHGGDQESGSGEHGTAYIASVLQNANGHGR